MADPAQAQSPRRGACDPPYRVVVFDCDSTLSRIEGIEDLAGPHLAEIAALTARAMAGELPLEAVYGKRLELIRPSREDLARVALRYAEEALPRARETVAALHLLGKEVHVVSGGLLPAVRPFAQSLGIDPSRVHAVDLSFDDAGHYLGFDQKSPLARAGGKALVLTPLAARGPLALVGDGATDLEAAPVCARFVAFTAVAARPLVVAGADRVCSGEELTDLLPHLLSEAELSRLASHTA